MVTDELKQRVDTLCDDLRQGGIGSPLVVVEQLSFLIHARLLDLNETRDQQNGTLQEPRFQERHQHLRWTNLRKLPAAELLPVVRDELFKHFRHPIAGGPAIAYLMGDTKLKIEDPALLKKMVDDIDALPLDDPAIRGDLYEYLLSLQTKSGMSGQFRTYRHIIRLMVDLLDPKPADTIADPACGTGGLLVRALQHLQETATPADTSTRQPDPDTGEAGQPSIDDSFYGFDISVSALRFATLNLMLHGIERPNIHRENTLGTDFDRNYPQQAKNCFDIVFSVPPLRGVDDFDSMDWRYLQRSRRDKPEPPFLVRILRMLKSGGRTAAIVPHTLLSRPIGEYFGLRRDLLAEHRLEAVIGLPKGALRPYEGAAAAILILTKDQQTDQVFFYNIQADGLSLDNEREPVQENDLHDCLARWRSRDPAKDTDRADKAFFVSAEEIKDANCNLSQEYYKEWVYEEEQHDPPQIILGHMKALNEEIAADLAGLQEMLE